MSDGGLTQHTKMWNELRSAVRFPLHLPVIVLSGESQFAAVTVNISTGGILLRLDSPFPSENGLEFLLEIPKEITHDESTAAIHCVGHVIRSFEEDGVCFVAAVIDDYRFQ